MLMSTWSNSEAHIAIDFIIEASATYLYEFKPAQAFSIFNYLFKNF